MALNENIWQAGIAAEKILTQWLTVKLLTRAINYSLIKQQANRSGKQQARRPDQTNRPDQGRPTRLLAKHHRHQQRHQGINGGGNDYRTTDQQQSAIVRPKSPTSQPQVLLLLLHSGMIVRHPVSYGVLQLVALYFTRSDQRPFYGTAGVNCPWNLV